MKHFNETHGHSKGGRISPTYSSWSAMMTRCYNPKHGNFPRYGGRGVKVCHRWHRFENFLADMGDRPPGTTIGRKKNDKGYFKRNCFWASAQEQSSNRSCNLQIELFGVTRTMREWSRLLGVNHIVIQARIRRYGWPKQLALIMPSGRGLVASRFFNACKREDY